MKRIKVILTAVTVLAVVGGALAFKSSSKFGTLSFCTKAHSSGPGTCAGFVTNSKESTASGAISYYAFRTTITGNCTTEQCDVTRTLTSSEL